MDRWICLTLCLAVLCGCSKGKNSYKLAPVSGVVTLDGKPLANAAVVFEPIPPERVRPEDLAAPVSTGITDANGRYELIVAHTGEKGAVPGRHRVRITLAQWDDPGTSDELPKAALEQDPLPSRYNDDSELEFVVPPEGTDKANFDLTSR